MHRRRPARAVSVLALSCSIAAGVAAVASSAAAPGAAGQGATRTFAAGSSLPGGAPRLAPSRAPSASTGTIAGARWNVVVVMTDDQNRDQLLDMPKLRRLVTKTGVQYPNAFIPTSTCCPSRASFLTGLYIDRTQVQDNDIVGVGGGYPAFVGNGNERRTLAVALHRAGYTTGLFGKYLNEYGPYFPGHAPPGWDVWRSFTSLGYQGFTASLPGPGGLARPLSPTRVQAYSTTWLGNQAERFIRTAPRSRPLFTMFTPYAPHAPATPEPKYQNTIKDDGWWTRNPGYAERDVSDKPLFVGRNRRRNLDGGAYAALAVRQRETLRSVDDEVGDLVAALKATGRWKKTLFVFMSDNGLMNGVHRLRSKYVPYRRATEVPLIIRYGQDRPPMTDARPAAANVDTAATILQVAGLPQWMARIDGVPLAGPRGRSGVPLAGAKRDGTAYTARPPYCGWRTPHQMFVRWGSGEEEWYDYRVDPYELTNRVKDPSVANRVATMRRAARAACTNPPAGYGPTFDAPKWTYPQRVP